MDDITWQKMSLTEKIRWRNLHPVMNSWHFVDKISAKDIAKKRAPECKVAKILNIPKSIENIKSLPKDYVFKANHGSKWVIKVKNGKNVATGEPMTDQILKEKSKDWLSRICGWGNEKQYIPITPKVFFEEFLNDITEFRCFCFEGKLKLIMVDVENNGKVKSTLYDRDWKRVHAHWRDPEGSDIKKPKNLPKIIRVVERLAKDIDFIRIDIYLKGDDIYFGEFTFTPNGGSVPIHPQRFDKLFGSYWTRDMAENEELKVPTGTKRLTKGSTLYIDICISIELLFKKVRRKITRAVQI